MQIAALEEQKKAIADQASAVERRINNLEDDNKRLREEGERLREELRFFRPDVSRGLVIEWDTFQAHLHLALVFLRAGQSACLLWPIPVARKRIYSHTI